MEFNWFKARKYKHFDRGVGETFARKVMNPTFVARHAFSPMIRYMKKVKRYKSEEGKTLFKERSIMYASHRDACILSFYASQINTLLDNFYISHGLNDSIIAYRPLGYANYHFSASAYAYALQNAPCGILAFDVSGFFDNLDHRLLKMRLKHLLGFQSLTEDWHHVFRAVTKFHFVELDDLKADKNFGEALLKPGTDPIATIAEIKAAGIYFRPNPTIGIGIPQGTPISAALSNLYMMDFDIDFLRYCNSINAFYRRYSDDILVVCPVEKMNEVEEEINRLIPENKLKLGADKTERTLFDPQATDLSHRRCAQYLGFSYYPGGAGLRPSSLSRQWRKMRRNIRKIDKIAQEAIASGKADKVWTKKLRRRFSALQFRNFSSYARRAAETFGPGEKISRQAKRFEQAFEKELKTISPDKEKKQDS